ncbi:MAG: Na/Pi cotransporter family protein [Phycisphaerae bacterium]|nr:Na/Pi cotransporter family protein [Phycisphaerae bacterium]
MIKDMIFGTVGGLGFFLFGMGLMSDGLKKVAGQKLKSILQSMTKKPWIAFVMGAGVTALIQSSSAATVMVVGFVNAALLTLRQAICVIIGTNVGTTATSWLVSISGFENLKITTYALPAVGIGFLLQVLGRTRKAKNMGQILLGFGILFVGISFLKNAFAPLEESSRVQELFIYLGDKPFLAIIAGTIVTMLLQSSSAAIAIVQLLAIGGAFGANWETALSISIPFVLGSNIGTTITAQLAAIGSNLNARRTAWAHSAFNILGAAWAYFFVVTGLFTAAVHWIYPFELNAENVALNIAIAHTIFNVVNSGIFLPLAGVLEKLVVRFVPEKPGDIEAKPVILEKHLLDTPVLALEQAEREIMRMAKKAKKATKRAIIGLLNDDRRMLADVRKNEDSIDEFQLEITSYLSELSRRQLSDEVSIELPVLLHTVNDLERIGDHAMNIAEIAERKIENKIIFSSQANEEASRLRREVLQMSDNVIFSLEKDDISFAKDALKNENIINKMQMDFRKNHVDRMTDGTCSAVSGLIFIDLVDNVEKIGDHLTNIAQAVIGDLQWEGIEPKTIVESK